MKEVHHRNRRNIGEKIIIVIMFQCPSSFLTLHKMIKHPLFENVKEGNRLNICLGYGNWYGIKIRVNYVLGH